MKRLVIALAALSLLLFSAPVSAYADSVQTAGSGSDGDSFYVDFGSGGGRHVSDQGAASPPAATVFWSDCGECFAGGNVSGACQEAAAACTQALADASLNVTTVSLGEGETLHYLVQVREESDGSWTVLGEDCTHIETTTVVRDYQPAAYEAFTAHLPSPAITTTGNVNVVNFETLLWLDTDSDLSFTATLLGDAAEIHAHLESVTWDYGDGTTGNSSTAGNPYSKTHPCQSRQCDDGYYLGHTYTHHGTVSITATVNWSGQYRIGTGTWQPITTHATTTANTLNLDIKQIHTVLVPN